MISPIKTPVRRILLRAKQCGGIIRESLSFFDTGRRKTDAENPQVNR